MEVVQLVIIFTGVFGATAQAFDQLPKPLGYSPCRHDDGNSVDCAYKSASEVLAAFHRNRNDADIERLFLRNITDMTDDILAEILDIVSTSASHKVHEIGLSVLPEVREVPESLMKFTNLESLYLEAMDKFKILPFGSIALPTNLTEIICVFNHNLKLIESGAFQGNFDGTDINLSFNGLKKFDEAVFKPLLSDSTATIQFFFNPVLCDCDLAWFLRDNRQYLNRVSGNCNNVNGNVVDFADVDANTLKNC